MAMRGSILTRTPAFDKAVKVLQAGSYPEVEGHVTDLEDTLRLGLDKLPRSAIGATHPGTYAHILDYPPGGPAGLRKFVVTYSASPPDGLNRRSITMLAIVVNTASGVPGVTS